MFISGTKFQNSLKKARGDDFIDLFAKKSAKNHSVRLYSKFFSQFYFRETLVLDLVVATGDYKRFFFFFVLFAIFILHSRESELYRYTLDGKSALAWELPFSRFMGHLSST